MSGLILPGVVETQIVEQEGRMFVGRTQDCTAIAEHAKALHNAEQYGSSEMRHAARIPYVVAEKYVNDRGISWQEFWSDRKHIAYLLNNPDNEAFRVWKGKV